MYDELLKKRIIVEMNKLVDSVDKSTDETESYMEFMKEVILNTYTPN